MAARLVTVYLDVPADALRPTVAFWAEALDATPRWPDDLGADPYVRLDEARAAMAVVVQSIGDGGPRYHLDLGADDIDAEADRLASLGATKHHRAWDWWTLTDPAGNWLCTIPGDYRAATFRPADSARGYLNSVFVDVPPELAGASVAFWRDALGVTTTGDGAPYTSLAGVVCPGGPVTFEIQEIDEPPRYHVDLTAAEVEPEVARLVAAGARRIRQVEDWWTLADPVGNLFCVVPPT